MAAFERYIGIDYSGAQTPQASLKGLRAYLATRAGPVAEVLPPPGLRKHWTRRGLADWLAQRLAEGVPTLVGIDHGFSFPLRYFEQHGLALDWDEFLADFCRHWPTDGADTYVDFVRDGIVGAGAVRMGNPRWRRLCEMRCGAKSVFHFDVQGAVAKSTHAGLPWLRMLRLRFGRHLHCWPFDGWQIPVGRSALAEVYPRLWKQPYPQQAMTADQHDAYAVACGLRDADQDGRLAQALEPSLDAQELAVARIEGWILGVS